MNRIVNILIIGLLLIASGCEQFVDEPKPEAEVGLESVFSSTDGINAFLTGTYRQGKCSCRLHLKKCWVTKMRR